MTARFLQIHFLTAYPGALLNRDDAGMAKRLPFGRATRTRISSQCLKRHWRTFDGEHALSELGLPETIRSRQTFQKYIVEPLSKEFDGGLVREVVSAVMAGVLGESAKAKRKKDATGDVLETGQVTVLGRPEVDFLLALSRDLCKSVDPTQKDFAKAAKDAVQAKLGKDAKANLAELRAGGAAGLSAALFGRMVTSDILARGDAAIHVAHAFTVHAEESEPDYFSAIDDIVRDDGEAGSGHIGHTELTSGLYYGYVVVDVPLLVSNLTGCARKDWATAERAVAAKVVERLIHLVATVSPGAKLGSTAPYSYARALLVESGNAQPRTLANAFLRPVDTRRDAPDLGANSVDALLAELAKLDAVYPSSVARQLVGPAIDPAQRKAANAGDATTLPAVAAWAAAAVAG